MSVVHVESRDFINLPATGSVDPTEFAAMTNVLRTPGAQAEMSSARGSIERAGVALTALQGVAAKMREQAGEYEKGRAALADKLTSVYHDLTTASDKELVLRRELQKLSLLGTVLAQERQEKSARVSALEQANVRTAPEITDVPVNAPDREERINEQLQTFEDSQTPPSQTELINAKNQLRVVETLLASNHTETKTKESELAANLAEIAHLTERYTYLMKCGERLLTDERTLQDEFNKLRAEIGRLARELAAEFGGEQADSHAPADTRDITSLAVTDRVTITMPEPRAGSDAETAETPALAAPESTSPVVTERVAKAIAALAANVFGSATPRPQARHAAATGGARR